MNKFVIGILVLLLIAGSLFSYVKINGLETNLILEQNKAPETIEVRVPIPADTTLLAQQAAQLKELTTDNKSLKKYLKATKADLKSQTDIIGELRGRIGELETEPVLNDSLARAFAYEDSVRKIEGFFQITPPYKINITKDIWRIRLKLSMVEHRDGTWETLMDTRGTPGLVIQDLKTNVKRYDPSWKEQLYLFASGYVGYYDANVLGMAGAEVGINLFQHKIAYGLDNRNTYLKYSYIKIWRPFK